MSDKTLADRLRTMIGLAGDDLERELAPYVDLYSEYQHARQQPGTGRNDYFAFNGPHERASYTFDIDGSNHSHLYFTGRDYDGDYVEFTMPISFIEESEQKAAELEELKVARAEEERILQEQIAIAEKKRQRDARHRQYLALKKEFEEE